MKRPLTRKEVSLILLPTLGMGAFAWYLHRVDEAGTHGMVISNFGISPETRGYEQSRGVTHRITFTVDHPWPRPRWWGTQSEFNGVSRLNADPLRSDGDKLPTPQGVTIEPENTILFGAALTTPAQKKNFHVWPRSETTSTFENGHYVFLFKANLAQIPPQAGAVTYHGLCRIAGQQSLRVDKVIRPQGQKTQLSLNKDTGNAKITVSTRPFITFTNAPDSVYYVDFLVSHPPTSDNREVSISDCDYVIVDGKGQRTKINLGQIGPINYVAGQISRQSPTQTKYYIAIYVGPKYKSAEPLTLSGKISVDEHWPIPFSVRLPKR
ncbi:hypothetical protein EON83_04090 [bacterium]|nr:MAG: hypothetical protein EON83_04090 [bacterium]